MSSATEGRSYRAWMLLAMIAAVFATYDALHITVFALSGDLSHTDFVGLWSFGRFVLAHPPAEIYQQAALHPFQQEIMPGFGIYLPYPYPPFFLLILAPFGVPDFALARFAWLAVSGAGLLVAAAMLAGNARRWPDLWAMPDRWVMIVGIILAPLSLINGLFGQTGFFTGALLCGGLALLTKRPVLAGILLGLLACKPQMGLLVPVALIAARAWGAIAAATLTILALALASGLILGWDLWPAWIASLVNHVGWMEQGVFFQKRLMPTILITLLERGVSPRLAWGVQGAVLLGMVWVVWRSYRRDSGIASAAVLIAATFLATPYAFLYDMPAVSVAMLALLIQRLRADDRLPVTEASLLLVGQMAPGAVSWGSGGSVLVVVMLALLLALAMGRVAAK